MNKQANTWIVQTNLNQTDSFKEFLEAISNSGATLIGVEAIPFDPNPPHIQSFEGPSVVYGSTLFVTNMQRTGLYTPGVFASPDLFTYKNWCKHIGAYLLNSPDGVEETTFAQVDSQRWQGDVFVRPVHDTKSFPGSVWDWEKFCTWAALVSKDQFPDLSADTPILIGTPFGIEAEWRLFIVDGEVATASQYQKAGRLHKERGAPQQVLEFAEHIIDVWNPVDAWVLDVCTSNGKPFVVEAQGFNSAGFYLADHDTLVDKVNQVVTRNYVKFTEHKPG